jgi:hypothetical protein
MIFAAAFFARQLAQFRPDRREQLDDDGRADVRHDAQRSRWRNVRNAPPANVLYMPSKRRAGNFAPSKKLAANAVAVQTGNGDEASNRQTASIPSVNKIRDFSSGILKQLANVLKMERNMNQTSQSGLHRFGGFAAHDFARAALGFDLRLGRGAERARADD